MVSILLIALLVILAVGAAAGTSALLVSRHAADAPAAPDPEDIANRIAQRAAQQQQAALGHLIVPCSTPSARGRARHSRRSATSSTHSSAT